MQLDLLIIGGGINGLGIAADAAARGLSVLLVEKGDFGSGTTAASSRLIHGGLRYLQYGEIGLVRESLRERGILARQRPHLIRPIRLLIPSYSGLGPPAWKLGLGLSAYNLLARDPLFPPSRALSRAEARAQEPAGLLAAGLTAGHLYPDAQVEFPERLCVELLQETRAAGGQARNHTRVTALTVRSGRVVGAELRDELTGAAETVEAALVVNAAGPWVDVVNRLLPRPPPPLLGGTWGTHMVLPRRPEGVGPRGHVYATARKDGRPFFLLPWDGRLLVGTTDVPFRGNPDTLTPKKWEIEYLLAETNLLFPSCAYTPDDVQLTTIGVRPLPASGRSAGAITRRHFLVDHARSHGIQGLGSVVGGKLTTYRSLAEEVVDWSLRTLRRPPVPCPTRARRASPPELRGTAVGSLSGEVVARLDRLYGPAAFLVEELALDPALAAPLAPGCPAIAAEAVHAVRSEAARTVDDVLRRRLVLLPLRTEWQAEVERLCERFDLPVSRAR